MAGRRAKPIQLHVIDGKKHLTKAEIKHRQENEIRLGSPDLKMSDAVRRDPVARKKFQELKKLYEGIEFVSSSDIGTITQLCLLYSELDRLQTQLANIERVNSFAEEEIELVLGDMEQYRGTRWAHKTFEKIEYIMSASGSLQFHKAMDAKRSLIRSLEDRLFLNPLAKIRNVPKKEPPKKQADPHAAMFGE
jgi:phage terminase small subunit